MLGNAQRAGVRPARPIGPMVVADEPERGKQQGEHERDAHGSQRPLWYMQHCYGDSHP